MTAAAKKYAPMINMSESGLYRRLKTELGVKTKPIKTEKGSKKSEPQELTEEDEKFLKRVESGQVSLDEASRFVAVRVFRKMMEHPDDVRFGNFFQAELLKIKQTEVAERNNRQKELINRMFGGTLPPTQCPNCGHLLYGSPEAITGASEIIEGEVA